MPLCTYKFPAYEIHFNRWKEEITLSNHIKKIVGIGFFAETADTSIIKKMGIVSLESSLNDEIFEIPVMQNSPLGVNDFEKIEILNTGNVRLNLVYKPMAEIRQNDYVIKMVIHYV